VEGGCYVDGDGAFADSSLAAGNCDDFFYSLQVSLAIEFFLFGFWSQQDIDVLESLLFKFSLQQSFNFPVVFGQIE
jgi:hypothetical protein